MIYFFSDKRKHFYVVQAFTPLTRQIRHRLKWLFAGAELLAEKKISGKFVGPRKEMITPWCTNAVEITRTMGIKTIERIELFYQVERGAIVYDPMLENLYPGLDQEIFSNDRKREDIIFIDDVDAYNQTHGLALNQEEITYLNELSDSLNRKLTDSEVFGFSQVNSEHCRHKIFNGIFEIDGKKMPLSLFQLIRKTSKINPNRIVSAYEDNVAFVEGPKIEQFAPENPDSASYFITKKMDSVLSLKAETHNFPTTVEPFNGAATGSGGEIRDRMAGGKGSIPLGGTAVYMTGYPRTEKGRSWERFTKERKWLYQHPENILIKASNGASDFGNKFGQPLICGSILTFEHFTAQKKLGYDKVIMLAGGIGFARREDSQKGKPEPGDQIIVMGGDNYRIGMGGGSVSSVATGEYGNAVELNAVQRSNPEMQKRVANVIRALTELNINPVVSVHDHGAGGHLNALSELIEATGGTIDISKLPVGDESLSFKEIVGNESQERMGLLVHEKDIYFLKQISERERAPFYVVGKATDDFRLLVKDSESGVSPIDLSLSDLFGNPPQTRLTDRTSDQVYDELVYDESSLTDYIGEVLQLEAVACKDWLTNKVDRSVTGKVALQQTTGAIQLPLNNLGIMALDYKGQKGVATSIGHAPVAGLIDPAAGSVLSVAEALTNLVWAPIEGGIKGVSLSANWMWPAKNEGENSRLYRAVEAISDFAIELGINIPTGKDSLSMKQKYKNDTVLSPGTVIVSTVGEVKDIKKTVKPVIRNKENTCLLYIDFSKADFALGGSSFGQLLGKLGTEVPTVKNAGYFARTFDVIQSLVDKSLLLAGHDISAGGLITCLLEMCFPNTGGGMQLDLSVLNEKDIVKLLFSEKPGVVVQIEKDGRAIRELTNKGVSFYEIGYPVKSRKLEIKHFDYSFSLDIDAMRDKWFRSSFLLDKKQTTVGLAKLRYANYKKQSLEFNFPEKFSGRFPGKDTHLRIPKAAIIREKGINGDREMAYALFAAGFEVKDIHMTDLISGKENLEEEKMIVFVGGFSNSDVLGSAKGWAGAFLYNTKAKKALDGFYEREDTLSLGVCNGCQLMIELNLLGIKGAEKIEMQHNDSGKFESSFLCVDIAKTNTVMLDGLENSKLGIWVAHGEGKFVFKKDDKSKYNIPISYSYSDYPGNPNGSRFNTAAVASKDGRHLAIMPHLERAVFPWQWAHYDEGRPKDTISPWFEAFVNARMWVESF